ncbi:hypothetical protein AAG906_020460 [Vitis piasezkii]
MTEYSVHLISCLDPLRYLFDGPALVGHVMRCRVIDDDFPDEDVAVVTSLSGWRIYFDGATNHSGYGIGAIVRPLLIESRSVPAYCCLIDETKLDDVILEGATWLMDLDGNRFSEPTNVDQPKRYYISMDLHDHSQLRDARRVNDSLSFCPDYLMEPSLSHLVRLMLSDIVVILGWSYLRCIDSHIIISVEYMSDLLYIPVELFSSHWDRLDALVAILGHISLFWLWR